MKFMKFLPASKFSLILVFPLLILLSAAYFAGFGNNFYQKEFAEYNVQQDVPNAAYLHENVINFIKGSSGELPNNFNQRETQHLADVRKIVGIFRIILYTVVILFLLLFFISLKMLKPKKSAIIFIGKVFLYGGMLTMLPAIILFFLINSNFQDAFESFHRLFFEKGTYLFDPANEIIVKLYPEQLFMDLGMRIAKLIILSSLIIILAGLFCCLTQRKQKKNKNYREL